MYHEILRLRSVKIGRCRGLLSWKKSISRPMRLYGYSPCQSSSSNIMENSSSRNLISGCLPSGFLPVAVHGDGCFVETFDALNIEKSSVCFSSSLRAIKIFLTIILLTFNVNKSEDPVGKSEQANPLSVSHSLWLNWGERARACRVAYLTYKLRQPNLRNICQGLFQR